MAVFTKRNSFPVFGGIGLLLTTRAEKTRLFFSIPFHRIGKIVLDVSDCRFHVLCVYSPTAVDHHRAECRTFYDEHSTLVNDIPLRDHILICGDLNVPLTADGCRLNMYVASRTQIGRPTGVHQPLLTNCCKRHHATKTKQVADLRRSEGEMHARRLDIRKETFQTT